MAKTQYSLSDDPTKLGAPKDFEITVRDVTISNGAGFAVIYTGNIMTMPGLPKVPAAEKLILMKTAKSADFSDMVKLISHSADETEQIGEKIAKSSTAQR